MLDDVSEARGDQAQAATNGGGHLWAAGTEESTASASSELGEAAALDLSALAGVVAGAQDGITIIDADRRVVYANPAACQMLGYPLVQLRGRDFLDSIPAREHSIILALFSEHLSGSVGEAPAPFSCNLLGPDGAEREIVYSTFVVDIAGSPHLVAIFQDLGGSRGAGRAAAALAQTAAQLVKAGLTTDEILAGIGRHAVEETRALACRISVVDEDHRLASAGGYGPGYGLRPDGEDTRSPLWIALADQRAEDVIAAITGGSIVIGEVPGKPVVVLDAPSVWEADPIIGDFAASLKGLDWHAGVYVPLSWENRVFGLFAVYLPTGVPGPSEAELAFYTALANHAAVVVVNARLTHQVRQAATAAERARLARELHDSVSQGLFSMTMHARAAQLAMTQTSLDADGALGRSIAELSDLTRGALAEMRALIFELRPAAVAEEGLVAALRKQAAALSARDQAMITMDGPEERLDLDAEVEEHLYRIASEALHNVVRHSGAMGATISVSAQAGALRLEVRDDGSGFDQAGEYPGHLGLSTMAERAATIGADFALTSAPGNGTTVAVSLPDDRRDYGKRTPMRNDQAGRTSIDGRDPHSSATERSARSGDRGHLAQARTSHVSGRVTPDLGGPSALADAAALGLSTLAGVLAGAQEGITVCDAERRFVYANPAACRMLGRPFEQLRGQDFMSIIPPQEHNFALGRFSERLDRSVGEATAPFSAMLLDPEGAEREIVCSTFAADVAGSQHGVTTFRDVTGIRAAARAAAALAQAASQLVGAGSTDEILAGIARHAVEGTRALACGISAVGEAHELAEAGGYSPWGVQTREVKSPGWIALDAVPHEQVIEALTGGSIVVGEVPGKPVVLSDVRSVWKPYRVLDAFVATLEGDWPGGGIFLPLSWENRVFGLFVVYLPTGVAGPSEAELAFCTALADHAAVAVTNARLNSRARQAAALVERTRLARELHDSVSQSLFSMSMHTRAAQLALALAGLDETGPLGRAIAELAGLTRGAMAEMRALIFELRPGALAEEGLVAALRKQAAALTAREETVITVQGPDERLNLGAAAEEHLYRIVSEALHNVVNHARAGSATVDVTDAAGSLRVAVHDDGAGFDRDSEHPGHLGLTTMAERAATIGAELAVASTPGNGTIVVVSLPHDRQDQGGSSRDAG
jgi:PAS domain S-box-containing protein